MYYCNFRLSVASPCRLKDRAARFASDHFLRSQFGTGVKLAGLFFSGDQHFDVGAADIEYQGVRHGAFNGD